MPRWLVWIISLVGFTIVGRWTLNSVMYQQGNPIIYPEWVSDSRDYVETIVAIAILWTIVHYDGRNRSGLKGSIAYNVRASLQWTYLFMAIGIALYCVYRWTVIGAVVTHVIPESALGLPNSPPDAYHWILWSVHAGITEEILVVGLVFFLIKRTSWQIGGTAFALTGWATAITVAIRISYHTYHEIWVLPMIITGWLTVRVYRVTGSLIPLIVAHIVWDVYDLFIGTGALARTILVVCIVLLSEVLTRGPRELSIMGFRQSKDKDWLGDYWGRWRHQPKPVAQSIPQEETVPA